MRWGKANQSVLGSFDYVVWQRYNTYPAILEKKRGLWVLGKP